jgi:hypothetical protein
LQRATKTEKADTISDGSFALFGYQSSEKAKEKRKKRKPKRDLSNLTYFGCDKNGHVITLAQTGQEAGGA